MNADAFPDPRPPTLTAPAWRRAIGRVVGMALLGAASGYALAVAGRGLFDVRSPAGFEARFVLNFWTLATLPLVAWICIVVHEMGHLLAGRLGGLRAIALIAGPLHLEFASEGPLIRWNRVAWRPLGLAICAPRPKEAASRRSFALLVGGGPLFSALFAAFAGLAAFAIGGWLGGLLFVTAAVSFVIATGTLVPMRTAGYASDGGQLMGLIRHDDTTRQRLAMSALQGQSCTGVRPRDWDPGLLSIAGMDSGDSSLRLAALAFIAAREHDQGDLDAADAKLRELAAILVSDQGALVPQAARRAYALMLAGWIGHQRREGASARIWLEASRGVYSDPTAVAYAESAVALAEDDRKAARRYLDVARAALPRLRDRGSAQAYAKLLHEIEQELAAPATDLRAV